MDRNGDRQPKFFRDFLQPYWVEFRSLMDKPQLWGYVQGQGWKHNFKTSNHYLSAKHCKTIALMCYRHPQTSDQHFYGFKLGVSQTEKKKNQSYPKISHQWTPWTSLSWFLTSPLSSLFLQRNPGVLRVFSASSPTSLLGALTDGNEDAEMCSLDFGKQFSTNLFANICNSWWIWVDVGMMLQHMVLWYGVISLLVHPFRKRRYFHLVQPGPEPLGKMAIQHNWNFEPMGDSFTEFHPQKRYGE